MLKMIKLHQNDILQLLREFKVPYDARVLTFIGLLSAYAQDSNDRFIKHIKSEMLYV